MRSRAALLPHPADPFLFKYWLKFFNEVWGDEVDKLYIYINSPIESSVVDYMLSLVKDNPKINTTYVGFQIEHGTALNEMLSKVREEHIMLIEDDGFIFRKGMVDMCFNALEEGRADIVGSPRGSCGKEIWDRAQELWQLDYSGFGDVGPNFWPNFLFTKTQHLLETDRRFGARAWNRGDMIEPLSYVVQDEVCNGDTFVNTSLQLRAKGLRFLPVPQYHGSTDDQADFDNKVNIFDGKAHWLHVGSLSSGVHGVLIDDFGRPLGRRSIDPEKDTHKVPGQCTSDQERLEWERRVTMWSLFLDNADLDAIPEFKAAYQKAIQRVIDQFDLVKNRIDRRKEIYHTIGL